MARYVIGIDEVGRGALAGPVVVAAALIPAGSFRGLRDSKKLSAKQREVWLARFKDHPKISYAVARVYPRGIERMNVSGAANAAALKAYKKLLTAGGNFEHRVFLDGGLFLGSRARQPKSVTTVAKADENIPAVAVASIIAKVTRDRFMVRLAKKYEPYGFEAHKGYGTAKHREAIKKYGSCSVHRKTFID